MLLRRRQVEGTIDEVGTHILTMLAGDLSSDEALAAVVAALREHDVVEETRQMARDWAAEAIAECDSLPETEAKTALVSLAHLMVDRMA